MQDDGPAFSVERLRLTAGRQYASEGVSYRRRDLLAIDIIDPLELTLSWEQLGNKLPIASLTPTVKSNHREGIVQ